VRDLRFAAEGRRKAFRELCRKVDVVLLVGAEGSSADQLRQISARIGVPSHFVAGPDELRREWVKGASRIGVAGRGPAPEELIEGAVDWLSRLGPIEVSRLGGGRERMEFRLPAELARV